jgi:hypothetical protein
MLYWISEVIRNTVHVTVSGTFATVSGFDSFTLLNL